MRGIRVGLDGVHHDLARRLGSSAPAMMRVESCGDPLRFAEDGWPAEGGQRVLIVGLGRKDVWSLLDELARWRTACPVVALHHGADVQVPLRAVASGVAGVVSVEAATVRILRLVDAVVDGDAVLPRNAVEVVAPMLAARCVVSILTMEERRWLKGLATGVTIHALGHQARMSERHMRRRLAQLYSRMGVANRDQAVALAARGGLID